MKKRLLAAALTFLLIITSVCGSITFAASPTLIYSENLGYMADASVFLGEGSFPEYYSSAELGYVSGPDDQLSTSICWAFTHNELIETYVAKTTGQKLDLSEQTMKFDTSMVTNEQYGHYRYPNDGGNEFISTAYLARGGVTLESDEPFSESEKRTANPDLLNYQGMLSEVPILSFTDENGAQSETMRLEAITHIKKLVQEYGAVGSAIYYDLSERFDDEHYTCYNFADPDNLISGTPNHAVTIVGWDDNYPADNFKIKPAGNGAFIIKNSWGNSHNDFTTDLVYVSYYDKFITQDIFATAFMMENDLYDNIYQYDYQGYTGEYSFGGREVSYATKYKRSTPGEALTAVSTYVTEPGTVIEVFVNAKNGSATDVSKYKSVHIETFEYAGFYLMELDEAVQIEGEEFVVAIVATAPDGNVYFPVQENLARVVNNCVQKKDTCYVSNTGFANFTAFEDFTQLAVRSAMAVMKAYTVKTDFELVDSVKMFDDVIKGKWYVDSIDFAVTYGIFDGTGDRTFSPLGPMTRAQFVQVLANISGVDTSYVARPTKFADVEMTKWYAAAILWAQENKIVSGIDEGHFAPDMPVTREQMCVMLVNYVERYLGLKMERGAGKFADHDTIGKWAEPDVYKCFGAQLVSGVGDNKFDPKSTANRAMGARIFSEFYKKYILV